MGKIFYIIGKSASGKDKIYLQLLESPELNLQKIVLYTTRPIRDGEENGKEYYFTDEKKLEELQKENRIIECRSYDTVYGIWSYFTAADDSINLKEKSYLGIGTLESYVKMKNYYGMDQVIPIYIEVEDGERLSRALKREQKPENQKYEEMCRRFLADQQDFSEENIQAAHIEKRFINDNFDNCVEQIVKYIKTML